MGEEVQGFGSSGELEEMEILEPKWGDPINIAPPGEQPFTITEPLDGTAVDQLGSTGNGLLALHRRIKILERASRSRILFKITLEPTTKNGKTEWRSWSLLIPRDKNVLHSTTGDAILHMVRMTRMNLPEDTVADFEVEIKS